MSTGLKLAIGAGAAVGLYLLFRTSSTAPSVAPSTSLTTTAAGLVQPAAPPVIGKFINAASTTAGLVGTGVGSYYLGPAGKLVGVQAATDTKNDLLATNNAVENVAGLVTGHESVGTAAKNIAGDVVKTATTPITTTLHIVEGIL